MNKQFLCLDNKFEKFDLPKQSAIHAPLNELIDAPMKNIATIIAHNILSSASASVMLKRLIKLFLHHDCTNYR